MICFKCLSDISTNEIAVHGLHLECFKEWFKLSQMQDFKDIALRSSASSDPVNQKREHFLTKFISSFFHGKYKKYSATLDGKHYILKVQDKDYPELPATEFLSNQIALELGINVPEFSFIRLEGKIETFVGTS